MQVGTARFISTLMARASRGDAGPHSVTLQRALMSAVRAETSSTVKKTYAAALAQVCGEMHSQ